MSSVNRTLSELFTKQLSRKTKLVRDSLAKANPTTQQTQLHELVHNFKSSCEYRRFRHSKANYRRTVRKLAAANQPSMIEDVLEHQKKYDDIRREGFAVRLIWLYGQSGMLGHARKVFDEMPGLGCPRTVKSFNALLKACVDAKRFGEAVEAFEGLPGRVAVEPNLYSHNTLLHALCQKGSVDDALSRLRELRNPDVVTFNTLLNALYSAGRFSEGEGVWALMTQSRDVEPDVKSYNARLRGMFRDGRASEAVESVCEMRRNGTEPDSFTYKAMIRGFCEKGDLEEAKKWYAELKKSGRGPNLVGSYSAIVSACCEAGDLDKAREVCVDAVDRGLALEPALIERVVGGLVGKGMAEEASKLRKLVNS